MSGDPDAKLRQLRTLMELSGLINSTLNIAEIRRRATEAAITLADTETACMMLVDREKGDLFFEVALGESGEMLKQVRLAIGQGIAGSVAATGAPVIVNDAQTDERFFRGADRLTSFTTRNMICVPIKTREKTIGVLEAINKKQGAFDSEDQELLVALANQIAIAIENASLYLDLKEAFYETTMALAETIEKRDPYTGGHTHRVMNYSVAIGQFMNLSDEMIADLRFAAILHDIGKIAVADRILLKCGKLEQDEVAEMNRHPEHGSDILRHVKHLLEVIPGVRAHHEKFDGTGYPDRKRGGEIPLIARIIAVADTFDAMTSDRPYRKALSVSSAVGELRRCSGTQFDPEVVNAFLEYLSGPPETGQADTGGINAA